MSVSAQPVEASSVLDKKRGSEEPLDVVLAR